MCYLVYSIYLYPIEFGIMGEKGTVKKLASFRFSQEIQDALNATSRITGLNKTEIVEASLRKHLPGLMKEVSLDTLAKKRAAEAKRQAAKDIKAAESILSGKLDQLPSLEEDHPTVDSSARKLARKAAQDAIEKVRGKKRKRAGSQ